jgi:hypothetical protein
VLATCATVAPWVVRNSLTYGTFVSLSTNRWRMIAQGNVSTDLVPRLRARSGEGFAYRGQRRPIERERIARDLAIEAIVTRQPWWLLAKIQESTRKLIVTKSQLARYVKRCWLAPRVVPVARVPVAVEGAALTLIIAAGVAGLAPRARRPADVARQPDRDALGDLRDRLRAQPLPGAAAAAAGDRRGAAADALAAVAARDPGSWSVPRRSLLALGAPVVAG